MHPSILMHVDEWWMATRHVSIVLISWRPKWENVLSAVAVFNQHFHHPLNGLLVHNDLWRGTERINVGGALRLMIKQIAGTLQILSGARVLLRTQHTVASSINCCRESVCKEMQFLLLNTEIKHTFKPPIKLTPRLFQDFLVLLEMYP